MTLTTANKDTMEMRRERVAQLRARQLTAREIAVALAKGDKDGNGRMVNPETGEPYTHVTILNDLKALKGQWLASANEATEEHAARQLFELEQLKRFAWSKQDGDLALKALDREIKLLGTAKDKDGININFNIEIVYQIAQLAEQQGLTASELFEGMLRRLQRANAG